MSKTRPRTTGIVSPGQYIYSLGQYLKGSTHQQRQIVRMSYLLSGPTRPGCWCVKHSSISKLMCLNHETTPYLLHSALHLPSPLYFMCLNFCFINGSWTRSDFPFWDQGFELVSSSVLVIFKHVRPLS